MKIFLLPLLFILISCSANYAQLNYNWAKGFGNANSDSPRSIYIDPDGQSFVVGVFSGTMDFDPSAATNNITAQGTRDGFINVLNASGDYVATLTRGGAGANVNFNSLTADAGGNIYILGSWTGSVDFDANAATPDNVNSDPTINSFLMKLDDTGAFLWFVDLGKLRGSFMTLDNNGDVLLHASIVAGATTPFGVNSGAGSKGFFAKLNPSGSIVFSKQFEQGGITTGEMNARRIVTDANNNIFITGNYTGDTDFDPSANSAFRNWSLANTTGYLAKYDANGNYLWANRIGLTPNGLIVNSGKVSVGGSFFGTVDIDPSAATSNLVAIGNTDAAFAQYDPATGTLLSGFSFSGSNSSQRVRINDIKQDATNNIYMTGSYDGIVDFDPSAGVSNQTAQGGEDIFISKFSNTGTFDWVQTISSDNSAQSGFHLEVHNANLYVSGNFEQTADFDPTAGTSNLTSEGLADIFVLKLSPAPLPVELIAFNGKGLNQQVQLDWQTATEINTTRYDVERSANGKYFEKIGEVKAKGEAANYTFMDKNPLNTVAYYRLKINDLDNTSEYSKVVNIAKLDKALGVKIYPNPFKNDLTVTLENNSNTTLEVSDIVGKTVFRTQNTEGLTVSIPSENWVAGTYFVKILDNTKATIAVQKIVKY